MAIAAAEENKDKEQFWENDISLKRLSLGQFHHLFTDLIDDEIKSFSYSRLSQINASKKHQQG